MKHNKKGEKEIRQKIAISVIKNLLNQGKIKEAIETGERNGIDNEWLNRIIREN